LLRRDVDRDTALVRLVGLLQRGTVPFLALREPGATSGGTYSFGNPLLEARDQRWRGAL